MGARHDGSPIHRTGMGESTARLHAYGSTIVISSGGRARDTQQPPAGPDMGHPGSELRSVDDT